MDPEEKEQELLEQAVMYLTTSEYPPHCSENRKRVILKKTKRFTVKDGELYYKQAQKGKVNSSIKIYCDIDSRPIIIIMCGLALGFL